MDTLSMCVCVRGAELELDSPGVLAELDDSSMACPFSPTGPSVKWTLPRALTVPVSFL